MADKYLNLSGLTYFYDKLKAKFVTGVKVNGTAATKDENGYSLLTFGTAAQSDSTDFDAAGAAAAVLGSSTDSASANTVYGAKAAAAAAQNDVDDLEALVGSTAVSTQIADAIGGLDSSISAETNKAIASVTITDGKITASTKITVPTNNNQLTNGAGYQTASDVTSAINTAIAGITGIEFEVVTTLPSTGRTGTIYLLSNGGSGSNIYDEYIYYNAHWEKIGSTAVDLSGYWSKTELTAITTAEIDAIAV